MEFLNCYFQAWESPWKKIQSQKLWKSLGNVLFSYVHEHSLIKRINMSTF